MGTPRENTEVVNMLRDVKNSIWNSLTPVKVIDQHFNEYISSLRSSSSYGSTSVNPPSISARLNFSGLDDSQVFSDSSIFHTIQTPESLKRKLINTEVELQASIAKVKERESLISVMEPANKKLCMNLENKVEESRKQIESDAEKIAELENQLRWIKKQMTASRSQVSEAERNKKVEVNKYEMKVIALQEDCSNLRLDLADVRSEKTESVRKLNIEIGSLEMKINKMSEEAEKSQASIRTLKNQGLEMFDKVSLCHDLQRDLKSAQEKIEILESKIEADMESALIVSSQQNDLKLLAELQRENRILKEESSKYKENNIALYQEKLWSLQEKLTQAEKKSSMLSKMQVENEQLKAKIEQWEALFDDKSAPFKSPTAFSRKLSQYQQNEAVLTNKMSHINSRCEILEKQKAEQTEKITSLNHMLQQNQMNITRQENVMRRMQRKIMLVSKERDNCRELLDSYLCESTMTGIAMNAAQIRHLEELNKEYKRAFEKSELEIDELNKKLVKLSEVSSSHGLTSVMKKLRDENAVQLNRIAELQKENTDLKTKCSQPTTSSDEKILHLRFNPLEAANQRHLVTFNKLQEENDQLKKRIKVLGEEGVQAQDVTMKVRERLESEGSDSMLQALKEQLAAAERKQRFILDNAKIKSREFREAVYRLTGYRIDVPTTETYKLSHLYAESRDDFLLFQINNQGIQLVETDYSEQLSERMELYLHQHDSFPAFLASVTLDLFNQQTFMMSSQ